MSNNTDLAVDAMAPEFGLPASSGGEIHLADYRSRKNIVLFFVREFE